MDVDEQSWEDDYVLDDVESAVRPTTVAPSALAARTDAMMEADEEEAGAGGGEQDDEEEDERDERMQVDGVYDVYAQEGGEDSGGEDDDPDSAEAQAREYDKRHYDMDVIMKEWDESGGRGRPTLHSRSATPTPRAGASSVDEDIHSVAGPSTLPPLLSSPALSTGGLDGRNDVKEPQSSSRQALVETTPAARARTPLFLPSDSRESSMATSPTPRARTPLFFPSCIFNGDESNAPRSNPPLLPVGQPSIFNGDESRPSRTASTSTFVALPREEFPIDEEEEGMTRRIPKNIAKYFDLAAVEDTAQEEDEDIETPADRDFIDDSPHDAPKARQIMAAEEELHRLIDFDGDEQEFDAEKIAKAIEGRARSMRYSGKRAEGAVPWRQGAIPLETQLLAAEQMDFVPPDVPQVFGAIHAQDLQALPTVFDPALYRVTVDKGREFSFLVWFQGLVALDAQNSKLISAFWRPGEAGAVYVETSDPGRLRWALQNQRVTLGALVPIDERAPLLETIPAHAGWARITKSGKYKGDLALLYDPLERHILLRHRDSAGAPSQLFRPAKHPLHELKWDGKKEFCVYRGIRYLQGLLTITVQPNDFTQRDVYETDEEMEGFRHVVHSTVDFADETGTDALAIAPGDRVVVSNAYRTARVKDDAAWRERRGGWVVTIRTIESTRYAAVCETYHNGVESAIPRKCVFYAPAAALRHHALRVPRTVQIHDRVLVVDGEHTGQDGRVVAMMGDTITLQPLPPPIESEKRANDWPELPKPITVPMKKTTLLFTIGDYVEVTRGGYKTRKGMIIALKNFGIAHVFDSIERSWDLVTGETVTEDSMGAKVDISTTATEEETRVFVVPTTHLKWLDGVGNPLPPPSVATSLIQDADKIMTRQDFERRHRLAKMLYTGRGFEARPVTIHGKHTLKGRHGAVVGWSFAKRVNKNSKDWKPDEKVVEELLLAENEEYGSRFDGTMVQVRLDGENKRHNVPIESIMDRDTRLPLAQSARVWWPSKVQDRAATPPLEAAPPDEQEELMPAAFKAPSAWEEGEEETEEMRWMRMEGECARAEEDGTWMNHPALVYKRLDVHVKIDRNGVDRRWITKGWGTRKWKAADKRGWTMIVDTDTVLTEFLHVRLDTSGSKYMLPASCLRPERTMHDNLAHEGLEPMETSVQRVVIIGPDHSGSREHIGKYAEIMPDAVHAHPKCIQVRYEAWFGLENFGHFPLFSLCRALNRQQAGAPTDPITGQARPMTSLFA
ncbi:hypothetical protein C8R46DRAFT_1240426 [Mycena filopes]|nr:hypothetical protein C8R46DRAFT_1240426 [Mycena filopes]